MSNKQKKRKTSKEPGRRKEIRKPLKLTNKLFFLTTGKKVKNLNIYINSLQNPLIFNLMSVLGHHICSLCFYANTRLFVVAVFLAIDVFLRHFPKATTEENY